MSRAGWVLLALLLPSSASAQSAAVEPAIEVPAWLTAWSPLLSRGDLPRTLPGVPGGAVPLLLLPTPTAGLFWTAGNPAALGRDLPNPRTDFGFGLGSQSGDYRRPLDPARLNVGRLGGSSWGRISPTNAMMGRVAIERETDHPGSRAAFADPYGSSPFTTVDTTISDTRRNRVVLEGASAWTLGDWSLGLALGIEARNHETVEAAVVRRLSRTMPGVTAGITRRLGKLDAGLLGGLRFRAENIRLYERSADTRATDLAGYQGVKSFEVSTSYERWLREYVPTAGLAIGSVTGAVSWSASAERVWTQEHQLVQTKNDPAEDRWDANGWRAALAAEPRLGGGRVRVLGSVRYQDLGGTGDLGRDSAEVIFTAEERMIEASAELRLAPAGDQGLTGVAVVAVRYEQRHRIDSVAALQTDIKGFSPSMQLELGHQWPRTLVALTASIRHYRPTAELPDPSTLGPTYRTFIAPELEVYTRAATPYAIGGLGRYAVSARTMVWLTARWEHLAPTEDTGRFVWSPEGTRTGWSTQVGVTLGL